MDEKYPGRMLLAEANQWPEDSLPYFGDGDECHMAFHFPVMPRMYMSLAMEDRFPIIDIMSQTPPIPENCQWAMFLRNHDELTLEMVTDEDRDYMWRTYAKDAQARINLGIRRRLAPLLENHRGRIHLMNGLLFSFPGHADHLLRRRDRHGRQHLPRRPQRRAHADAMERRPQCRLLARQSAAALPAGDHRSAVSLRAGERRGAAVESVFAAVVDEAPHRHAQALPAFGRGTMEFLHTENRKILAYVRRYEDEIILVVANLSRLVQCFELDLSQYRGMVPVELSGGTKFPVVGERPYFLNLGPFAFYWFALQREVAPEMTTQDAPLIARADVGGDLRRAPSRRARAAPLRAYLPTRRWFGGKARTYHVGRRARRRRAAQ